MSASDGLRDRLRPVFGKRMPVELRSRARRQLDRSYSSASLSPRAPIRMVP